MNELRKQLRAFRAAWAAYQRSRERDDPAFQARLEEGYRVMAQDPDLSLWYSNATTSVGVSQSPKAGEQ